MKNFLIFLAIVLLVGNTFAQEKLYLVFELMRVDNEQENTYWETETFWEKIHQQRVKNGDILGWDLWALQPGGEDQGYQYMTVTLFDTPAKMFKGMDLMAYTKKAYPNMSEDELTAKLENTGKTRDLAVRLYLESIAKTNGDFKMDIGTVAFIDFMKAKESDYEAYVKAEKEVFQPMHQRQVDVGDKGSWELLSVMLPYGSDTYTSHITVNMFKDIDQVFKESSLDNTELSEEQEKAINDGLALRDFKFSNMATLVKKVRKDL